MMIEKPRKPKAKPAPLIIGWREHVDLPELDLLDLPAKIDTGARTSALHAANVSTFERDGKSWVRFSLPDLPKGADRVIEKEIHDAREIKNTSGVAELRLIIRTPFVIAGRRWAIDVSLADRGNMQFPLIVGRSALSGHRIAVDTGRSYLTRRGAMPEPNVTFPKKEKSS